MCLKALTILNFLLFLSYFRKGSDSFAVHGTPKPSHHMHKLQLNSTYIYNTSTTISTNRKRTIPEPIKKWQVGRVSRKQYEIINMLWRKSNVFHDVDDTLSTVYTETKPTTKYKPTSTLKQRFSPASQAGLRITRRSHNQKQTSTSSYIEFYYLDELEDTNSTSSKLHTQISSSRWNAKSLSRSPFFALHFNQPGYKSILSEFTSTGKAVSYPRMRKKLIAILGLPPNAYTSNLRIITQTMDPGMYAFPKNRIYTVSTSTVSNTPDDDFLENETCRPTTSRTSIPKKKKSITKKHNLSASSSSVPNASLSTTYDKIKFFEMYDSFTHDADNAIGKIDRDDYIDHSEGNYNNMNDKILLEHVDNDMRNNEKQPRVRYAKKHVTMTALKHSSILTSATIRNHKNIKITKNFTANTMSVTAKPKIAIATISVSNRSKYVELSEYPFAAVYVYDRYQVHCDAGIISPHWLIAAGSCLARHTKEPTGEGRSAFVSYCGENWWDPERITYVKYSVVHPRFHPIEKSRRNLYNIGLIQVVTSMAQACMKFAPISVISHSFVGEHGGSVAMAVGWGLDRYDRNRISSDLPRKPLAVYEGLIHSDSCPGNSAYRRINMFYDDGMKNVYCLSLPPYIREESDPVHGGLLLVGGNLIGLYLQEERRPWGDQSAQYTGIWHLVPWVHKVAREPEETDFSL